MTTDFDRLRRNLSTLADQTDAEFRRQAGVNRAVAQNVLAQRARISDLDGRVTTVESDLTTVTTGLTNLSDAVVHQGGRIQILSDAHEITATTVDRHDQQIAEHDSWFKAIFERIGDRVDWLLVMLIGFVVGLISIPFWYAFVFKQYGLAKHFADPKNQLVVDIPADPVRMWVVSIACGVVVMFAVAFVFSFFMNRKQTQTNAQPPANAAATPAPTPAPTLELPAAPPPPVPAPANAGQGGNAQAAAAQ